MYHAWSVSFVLLNIFSFQFSLAQLQELCKGVQNNDQYSHAVLKECSKKSVTVELKLKYVSISNIAGVKFELFCNNETIITLHDYYQLSSKTVIRKFPIDNINLKSCILVSCYHTTYGSSYNISSDRNTACTFENNENIIVSASSNNVTSTVQPRNTATLTAAADHISSTIFTPHLTSVGLTSTTLEITTQISASVFPTRISLLSSPSTSSSSNLANNEYHTSVDISPPSSNTNSIISSVTQTNHFQSSYYESLSSRLTTLSTEFVIIAVICGTVTIAIAVSTLVSCLIISMKSCRISSPKTETIQENELLHDLDYVYKDPIGTLSLSPSLVTLISPLNAAPAQRYPVNSNKCTTVKSHNSNNNEADESPLSVSFDDNGTTLEKSLEDIVVMDYDDDDVEKSLALKHFVGTSSNQLEVKESSSIIYYVHNSGEYYYYDRLSYCKIYENV